MLNQPSTILHPIGCYRSETFPAVSFCGQGSQDETIPACQMAEKPLIVDIWLTIPDSAVAKRRIHMAKGDRTVVRFKQGYRISILI